MGDSGRAARLVGKLAIFTMVAAIDGCGGPTTSPTYRNPESRAFAQSAMAQGPMLVILQGRPFTEEQVRTQQVVLDNMRRAMTWTATPRLIADPAGAPTSSLYVVMTFNSGAIDANVQCTVPPGGGGPQERGAVQVAASFCGSGSLISNTYGRLDASNGPDDPAFGRLISQVTTDLFPAEESPWQRPGFGFGVGIGSGGWSGGGVGVGIGF